MSWTRKLTIRSALLELRSSKPIDTAGPVTRPKLTSEEKASLRVERKLYSKRLSLKDIKPGDKHLGQIISFTKFGMYVDVGAVKDGLVHIKDTSSAYFVADLESQFRRGQEIDTWVKFVDAPSEKLGLQLFPVSDSDLKVTRRTEFEYGQLYETQRVTGRVVKASLFGLFLDINTPGITALPLAYLHKRKMSISKAYLKLRPWQIHPIGSTVDCFVYSVDKEKHRIELSTYDPVEWNDLIPEPKATADVEEQSNSNNDDDEQQVPRYTSMQGSKPLLTASDVPKHRPGRQNTVLRGKDLKEQLKSAPQPLQPKKELDEDDLDDETKGGTEYSFSQQEIDEVMRSQRKQLAALLKDAGTAPVSPASEQEQDVDAAKASAESSLNAGSSETSSSDAEYIPTLRSRARVTPNLLDAAMSISLEDLFRQLSNRQGRVGVKDVLKWPYLRALAERRAKRSQHGGGSGPRIDQELIKQIMRSCGSPFGSVNFEQFEEFIRKLSEALSTPSSPPSRPRPAAMASSKLSPQEMTTPAPATDVVPSDPKESLEEKAAGLISQQNATKSVSASLTGTESTEEIMAFVFHQVSGGKPALSLADIYSWEFIVSFIRTSDPAFASSANSTINSIFARHADKRNKCINSGTKLQSFVDDLCEAREKQILEAREMRRKGKNELAEPMALKEEDVDRERLQESFDPAAVQFGGDEADQMALAETFELLAEGSSAMTWKQLCGWELVQLLLGRNLLEEAVLEKKVSEFGGVKDAISIGVFDKVVDFLVYLYSYTDEAKREIKRAEARQRNSVPSARPPTQE